MARFDYSQVGLVKADHITLFDGEGVANLDDHAQSVLANYGLFVMLTRTLAGHEDDGLTEKRELIKKTWNWLKEGCPKREKVMISAYDSAVTKCNASTELTAKEKAQTLKALAVIFGKE
jgi:hypothetical protein